MTAVQNSAKASSRRRSHRPTQRGESRDDFSRKLAGRLALQSSGSRAELTKVDAATNVNHSGGNNNVIASDEFSLARGLARRGRACRSLLATAPLAQAQDKTIELKLSHWVPPSHPLQKAMRGVGRIGREGLERHDQVQDLPVAAARQGVRPLRHGARRHRRLHLRQSGLSARPLPDHRAPANCRSWSATPRAASARSTPGIASTPRPR